MQLLTCSDTWRNHVWKHERENQVEIKKVKNVHTETERKVSDAEIQYQAVLGREVY